MSTVVLDKVTKIFSNQYEAIHDLSLSVQDGEFLVLVGPSGCGKSTVLRMIAGLEEVTAGEIRVDDLVVNNVQTKDRDIAMVFQNYALYPHMTVFDNIAFVLKLAKRPKREIAERVQRVAETLELTAFLDRKPGQLSGGQRQRTAMGRAIVRQPSVFLMDEPLSDLDAKLRVRMRAEIAALQHSLGVTTIYVTHDQVEAMTMGDRVAVMNGGHLQQVDRPQRLYDRPTNVFVASFIGSPAMSFFRATLTVNGDGGSVQIGSHNVALSSASFVDRPSLRRYDGSHVIVGIRAEDFEDAEYANGPIKSQTLTAEIQFVEALGSEIIAHFTLEASPISALNAEATEDIIGSSGKSNAVGRFNPRSRVRSGDVATVVVAVENLHFFDFETHEAIWD